MYLFWLIGQIFSAGWVIITDTLTGSKKVDPCVVHYPLRVQSDFLITAFAASITVTPGTMSVSLHEEADGQRYLSVHAVHGSDPAGVLDSLADMEEKLSPKVKAIPRRFGAKSILYPAPAPMKVVK